MDERPKILIVDDRKDNLLALRGALQEEAADIIEAMTGDAALAATLDHDFALAILDVRMPEMDGYELAGLMRCDPKTAHLPIIFMTGGCGDEEQIFKGYESGAVDYILKPYNHAVLLSKVRVFLDLYRAQSELGRKVYDLAASENQYQALVETVPDIVYRIDTEGRFTFLNDAIGSLGYRAEDLIGRQFAEIMLPADVEEFSRRLVLPKFEGQQTGDEGAPKLFDERRTGPRRTSRLEAHLLSRQTGGQQVCIFELNSSGLYRGGEGQKRIFIGSVGVMRDISERKRAEQELARHREHLQEMVDERTQELKLANDRLRLTQYSIDHATLAVFWLGPEGRFYNVNAGACQALGYTREELMAMTIHDIDPNFPAEAWPGHWRELKQKQTLAFESVHRAKDGHEIPVEITVTYCEFEGQEYNFARARDITERKLAEEEHRRLEEKLRQAQNLESIGRLAGGVAHDFNNILTGIKGYVGFAADEAKPGSQTRQYLTDTLALADRAASLTRQLLAFSRKQIIRPVAIALNQLIVDQLNILHRHIGENINIQFDPAADLGQANADQEQVQQILINLAANARDAMPNGGNLTIKTANVELSSDETGGYPGVAPEPYVMMAVRDDGCGMAPEILEHIFEPFFTTKETGKGTGLGLATVYGIVKQHGGNVRVESEPGKGTTFRVYLPRVGEMPEETKTAPPKVHGGAETILLVEDEESLRIVCRRTLENRDYTVLCAANAREAEALLADRQGEVDLLLTDVVMPGRNGRELYEGLVVARPGLRVLYMSGYNEDDIIRHGEKKIPFIHKPFAPETLAAKVRQVLDVSGDGARRGP